MSTTQKQRVKNYCISTEQKNGVLDTMINLLDENRMSLIQINKKDLEDYTGNERAIYDRLIMDNKKINGMISAIKQVRNEEDPVGKILYSYSHPKGMNIKNITAPFGSILIIYESRPDVTIEAAVIAFKAGNSVLLKGGKEAKYSNLALVDLWHKALKQADLTINWIQYLQYNRQETQAFLSLKSLEVDLIIPRGGEGLIKFVKENTNVPVLVSGRGNNFLYVHEKADWDKAHRIILNAKTDKISACNALDKVLIDKYLPNLSFKLLELAFTLSNTGVELWVTKDIVKYLGDAVEYTVISDNSIWKEEFLSMKIVLGLCQTFEEAINLINENSGGHSVSIITEDDTLANTFMNEIDAAAVYHNCSTRFTDGGEFGLGAEMAISTDKLHHRGPLGLKQLVSNKWLISGNGQIR